MARQSKTKESFDPKEKELIELLKHYWLVTNESPMMYVIKRVVEAKFHHVNLTYYYLNEPTERIEDCLTALNLRQGDDFVCIDYDPSNPETPRIGLFRIPSFWERMADFELFLPSCVAKLRQKHPKLVDWNSLRVELPAVFWFRHYMREPKAILEDLLLDYVRTASDGVIRAAIDGDHPCVERLSESFYQEVCRLRTDAAAYLGISQFAFRFPDSRREINLELSERMPNSWFNYLASNMVFKGHESTYPYHQVPLAADLTHIGVISRNLYHLAYPSAQQESFRRCQPKTDANTPLIEGSEDEWRLWDEKNRGQKDWRPNRARVLNVLLGRLQRRDERDLQREVGFQKDKAYQHWQADNHISLVDYGGKLKPKKIYSDWEKARDSLFAGHPDIDSELHEITDSHDFTIGQPETQTPNSIPLGRHDEEMAQNACLMEGNVWTMYFRGQFVGRYSDQIGFRYLALLLAQPDQEFSAPDLENAGKKPSRGIDLPEITPEEAIAEGLSITVKINECLETIDRKTLDTVVRKTKRKLKVYKQELKQAKIDHDIEKQKEIESHISEANKFLNKNVDILGRSRTTKSEQLRAQERVQKNIQNAIKVIGNDPSQETTNTRQLIVKYLSVHIKLGKAFRYYNPQKLYWKATLLWPQLPNHSSRNTDSESRITDSENPKN